MHLWSAGLARDKSAPAVNTRLKNNPKWAKDRERPCGASPHLGLTYLARSELSTSKSLSCSATCRPLTLQAQPEEAPPGSPPRGVAAIADGRPDARSTAFFQGREYKYPWMSLFDARVGSGVWSLDHTQARAPPMASRRCRLGGVESRSGKRYCFLARRRVGMMAASVDGGSG